MRDFVRALGVMIELSVRADLLRSIAALLTATLSQVAIPVRALGLKLLTDGIAGTDTRLALSGAALVVGLTAASRITFWASFNVRMRLRENTQVYLDSHVMQLTAGVPGLEHHERPDYLDNVELVRDGRWYLANPFNPISWTIASMFQLVSIFVLLAGVHPLLIVLPLGGVPSIVATLYAQRQINALRESQAHSNRLLQHLQDLATDTAAAKEIRIFGLTDVLLQRRRDLFADLEGVRLGHGARQAALSTAAWAFFAVCFAAAIAFTVDLSSRQLVSIGAVMLVLGLGAQLNFQLAILVENIAWLIRTRSAIGRLMWLRDYAREAERRLEPAHSASVPLQLRDGIRFSKVSFRYPGVERPVLEDLDLHLPAGSTIAIVGENGAGKTTLVKLLSRFYEPTSGTITIDGVDLRSLPIHAWRRRLAAGFQDFARLELLARESIGVGDTDLIHTDASIVGALQRAAAADVQSALPAALDTQLGRYFDGGVDLSAGQWQKIALGRAMMRERILLLLLDEPTASLDAPTEHALFEHFASAASSYAAEAGAITVLVSHRFSTVRMADLILVTGGGRIVERGTHAELMRLNGIYAELYGLQASAYR